MNNREKRPLVSVIIPVYNVEPYLRQCLDSVVGQTYRELEILIIDDGSTDNGGQICDFYGEKDERVMVFHTENRGLSAARNLGLDHSEGEYIAFIDSDDWFEMNAIETALGEALENDADIVCFRCIIEYKLFHKTRYIMTKPIVLSETEIMSDYCSGSNIGAAAWNKLYKAELFTDIRFPERRNYEDFATTYRLLLRASKVSCIPFILIHYRVREGSITKSHDLKNIEDYWWARCKCYEELCSISVEYGNYQLGYCIEAIGRMWRWYSGFKKDEKRLAKRTLKSMQRFSSDHRREVLSSGNISLLNKIFCVCSVTTNPLMMRILYCFTQLFRKLKNEKSFE